MKELEARARPKRSQRYCLNSGKFLSDEEYLNLTSVLKRTIENKEPGVMRGFRQSFDKRDALLLSVALRTGARATEVLNLRKRDFSHIEGTLLIRGIKGSNDREIPLPPSLARHLERHLRFSVDGPDDRIFPISYPRLNQIWLYYRPANKQFHSLRHTFALMVYKKTRDIKLVQLSLGHRQIANTMIYLDYLYSIEEMRRVIF